MPAMLTYSNIVQFLKEHLLACPSRMYLHVECPGCGFQRSFIALLNGDVNASLALYPATIPILIMIIFSALHLKYKFLYGAAIIKYLVIAIAIVILVFYIYRLIHLKIFA